MTVYINTNWTKENDIYISHCPACNKEYTSEDGGKEVHICKCRCQFVIRNIDPEKDKELFNYSIHFFE